METKTVKVYDTVTKKLVDVEVSQEVYEAYMRTGWNIHDNDESFYEHEIQFSQLIGGKDSAFENFREFIVDGDPTADHAILSEIKETVKKCITQLRPHEAQLITMIYFEGLSEQECAEVFDTTRQNIHNKHKRILAKIHKLTKI